MFHRFLDFISSLKLTIICLGLAIILVLVGTLAQVNYGIHEVQQRYFQSLIIWWPAGTEGFKIPIFPGGHLLGGVLLLNLLAAHIRRFQWTWRKLGIQLAHAGLIIMLAGALFTDLFSVESYMRLAPGETKNYSEDSRAIELAVIDQTDKDHDRITAIPEEWLRQEKTIAHPSLPFQIIVRHFYQNSRLQPIGQAGPTAVPAASQGVGAQVAVTEVRRATAENERDLVSAVIEVAPSPSVGGATAASGTTGTWLVSDQLGAPQTFSYGGKTWRLLMRQARYYKPYSLTLQKFTHERYAGTGIAKNFATSAKLIDPERNENRDVLIYMNHPLRYRGETFFQSGFEENEKATILQVVYNPSFIAPYIACAVVSLGLIVQFAYHFAGFLRRRKTDSAQ